MRITLLDCVWIQFIRYILLYLNDIWDVLKVDFYFISFAWLKEDTVLSLLVVKLDFEDYIIWGNTGNVTFLTIAFFLRWFGHHFNFTLIWWHRQISHFVQINFKCIFFLTIFVHRATSYILDIMSLSTPGAIVRRMVAPWYLLI